MRRWKGEEKRKKGVRNSQPNKAKRGTGPGREARDARKKATAIARSRENGTDRDASWS